MCWQLRRLKAACRGRGACDEGASGGVTAAGHSFAFYRDSYGGTLDVRPSVGRAGSCHGNAAAEPSFGTPRDGWCHHERPADASTTKRRASGLPSHAAAASVRTGPSGSACRRGHAGVLRPLRESPPGRSGSHAGRAEICGSAVHCIDRVRLSRPAPGRQYACSGACPPRLPTLVPAASTVLWGVRHMRLTVAGVAPGMLIRPLIEGASFPKGCIGVLQLSCICRLSIVLAHAESMLSFFPC